MSTKKLQIIGNLNQGANVQTDAFPIDGSTNPVQSGGVYDAIEAKGAELSDRIDAEISTVNTSIANITSGNTVVKEATHASSANSATTASSATKATQDASGNIITSTYETKGDASAKLTESKEYTNSVASGKANTKHNHAISDVTNLQTILDGKAEKSHGTHVTFDSTNTPKMDGTAAVGTANTVSHSDHVHPTDTSRASKSEFDAHADNTTVHITSTERTNWNSAHSHISANHVTGVKGSSESTYRTGQVNITKANIGLGNVDNTSDNNKPVSTAQQDAIDAALDEAKAYTDDLGVGFADVIIAMYGEDYNEEAATAPTVREIANNEIGSTLAAGSNVTITKNENDKLTISAKDTTYSNATTSAAGLMSKDDKSKLNGIATGANKTVVDSSLSSSSTNPVQNKVINDALSLKLNTELKGRASGLAELDANGKVPTAQLPSYVDDVIEGTWISSTVFKNSSNTAIDGETGKIYVDTTTNKTYRWSGTAFVEISASLALGTTSSTAYYGDKGKLAYEHSQSAHAPTNAEKNQNAFSNVKIGDTTIAADTATDTLTLAAGDNVTITPNATNDTVTIASTDTGATSVVVDGTGNAITSASYSAANRQLTLTKGATYNNYSHPTSAGNKHIPAGGSSGQILRWASDGMATWGADTDTIYTHPTTAGNKHIPTGGQSGQILRWSADGTATWGSDNDTVYTHPTYTARTGVPTAAQTPAFGGSFNVSQPVSDGTGHITAINSRAVTIPSTLSNGVDTAGLIKTTSTVTSTSGYTASPVINGVPYYKDTNTTYTNEKLGQGYGTCATAAATVAKAVTLSSYTLTKGGVVAVKFTYAVPANATMNINSKGAKPIFYKGAPIVDGIICAGEVATFMYDGTNYHVLAVDRNRFYTSLVPYGTAITASETAKKDINTVEFVKVGNYYCSSNANAAHISNLPISGKAFMMQVYSPLSQTVDNEGGTWVYRIRKLTHYTGEEYIQYCSADGTAGVWGFGAWQKIIRADDIDGAISTIANSNLTASRALVSDANGKVAVSAVTSTELGYLDGVTSNIQTQLDGKATKSQGVFYIEGSSSSTTDTTNKVATWIGSHNEITSYFNGLTILYKVVTAGSTTTTLNINNLGAVKVVRNATTGISTACPVDGVLLLTYTVDSDGTAYWKTADYDANTKNTAGTSNKTGSKMYLVGGTSQSSSGVTTYTNKNVYIGTDNSLYSNGDKVATIGDIEELYKSIIVTIPKARMKGDVDGDGIISDNDADMIVDYVTGVLEEDLDEIALWCCKIVDESDISASDGMEIKRYVDDLSCLPLADYYNNWTFVTVDGDISGYFYTDIEVDGITSSNSAIIMVNGSFVNNAFIGAECIDGGIRIKAKHCPINDTKCIITYGIGDGSAIISTESINAPDLSTKQDKIIGDPGELVGVDARGAVTTMSVGRFIQVAEITPETFGAAPSDHTHDMASLGAMSKFQLLSETAINGSSTSSKAFVQIGTLNLQGDLVIIGVKGTLKGHHLILGDTSSKNVIMKNNSGTATSSYSDYRYFTLLRHGSGYIPITNVFTNDVSNVQVQANCPVCVQCTAYDDDNDPAYIVTFNGTIRVYGGSLI